MGKGFTNKHSHTTMKHLIFKLLLMAAAVAWSSTTATAQNARSPQAPARLPETASQQPRPVATQKVTVGETAASAQENTALNVTMPHTATTTKAQAHKAKVNAGTAARAPRKARAYAPPASATTEQWKIATNFYNVGGGGFITFRETVKVAIDGNNIYVAGLDYWLPDAWVQGTIDGDRAVFPTGQVFGLDGDDYDYFVGYNTTSQTITDVIFKYNATAKKLTLADNIEILIGSDTEGSYWAYHINTVMAKEYVEPIEPIDIADGTTPSAIIPVYGARYSSRNTSQIIYPASMLANAGFESGKKIKSVTFYTNDNGIQFRNGEITVTLGTTNATYFTSASALTISGTTATATVVPTRYATTLKVEFDTPLEYTAGKNLIIQLVNSSTGNTGTTNWYGVEYKSGNTYYSYNSNGARGGFLNLSYVDARFRFMPKTTFEFEPNPPVVLTDELDFGAVEVGSNSTLTAYVENPNSEAVTATVTTSAPFSATSTVTLKPGANDINVTFAPKAMTNYNGTLTVTMGGATVTIPLKGYGNMAGVTHVTQDEDFFAGISYDWIDDNGTFHTSTLNEVATDPNQMIAMMREVYTNRTIPGTLKRGYTDAGGSEDYDDVYYSGVGTISRSSKGYDNAAYYSYQNGYGWNIPGTIKYANPETNLYAAYMDTTQYKPYQDGLTLLLVEMKDDFDLSQMENKSYSNLKYFISYCFKSVRVVTEAKRTGTGVNAGTLFKIDCDKMNKYFLLTKGQLRWAHNEHESTVYRKSDGKGFYLGNEIAAPAYFYFNSTNWTDEDGNQFDKFVDTYGYPLFYHMFEQYSPVATDAEHGRDDIYQDLINMETFGVEHDCASVPLLNHHFMMYGDDSGAADCQDVRDLMFFIPDYRMMKDDHRDPVSYEKYLYYNQSHRPTLGLYVIRQDEITPTKQEDDYYMLQLNWRTNLDAFLPSDEQEFFLYQVVYNEETGRDEYVSVYYMNENGEYTDANGKVVSEENKVPIVLQMEAGQVKNYPNVYVARQNSSQQVTYAIQGYDTGHFLSLQMSNQMSYIIPGKDPKELVSLVELSHYSRFNPETVTNCYSNRFKLCNNVGGITQTNVSSNPGSQNVFTFTRKTSSTDENPVTVATATITATNANGTGGTIRIEMQNQSAQNEFPRAKQGGYVGYHANPSSTSWTQDFTYNTVNGVKYVNFGDLVLCDNFVVDVSNNEHPSQYIYEVNFSIIGNGEHNFNEAHGNAFRVTIYKAASQINGSFTQEEVDGETGVMPSLGIEEDVKFGVDVQYSSRTEILRYDTYRWSEGEERYIVNEVGDNDDEQDCPPTGLAMNQGDYYTVSMNPDTDNETNDEVSVSGGTATATFVDEYIPNTIGAYVYAPVVETFTTGKDVDGNARRDYNTYGGPLQNTAIGKFSASVVEDPSLPNMSSYTWTVNGDKYAYYNVFLQFSTANVPKGFQLYKVRAWRQAPTNLLGEREGVGYEDRVGESIGDGMNSIKFEEITNGTDTECTIGGDADITKYMIGKKHPDENVNVWNATFGARKVGNGDGEISELPLSFIVRAYFTKSENIPAQHNGGSAAPRRADSAAQGDGKFYVVEQTIPYSITNNKIVTGVNDVMAAKQVSEVIYYDVTGKASSKPFTGVNVKVTRYADGTVDTTKFIK